MFQLRRPIVAVATMLVIVVIQLLADPIGVLALVGWPGGVPQAQLWWPIARYVVFVPVLLAAVWWAARVLGDRFWLMTLATVWAVLLAQFATLWAMTWDGWLSAWGAGFVLAKSVPAAVLVALFTRFLGGRTTAGSVETHEDWQDDNAHQVWRTSAAARGEGVVWPGLLVAAGIAALPAGYWWAAPVTAAAMPVPQVGRPLPLLLVGLALWLACTWAGVQFMRRLVPSRWLGPWLGYVLGGGVFGLLVSIVAAIIDGASGDLWPVISAYMRVADGTSLGVAVGLVAAPLTCVLVQWRERASSRGASSRGGSRRAWTLANGVLAVLLVALVLFVPATPDRAAASAPAGMLRVEGGRIADGAGNEVLLRGVNVNQLVDFYQYDHEQPVTTPFTRDDVEAIAAYGFNVIRLNISWSALEPERGSYDEAYLEKIDDAIAWGRDAGVYTVIDMHQDGWWNGGSPAGVQCRPGTEPMWGYDGAPEWATITDGAPRCQFTGRDISPAGNRAFEHFYFNTEGVRDALAQTWGMLGARYANESMVAGFDLFNEPGFGETAPATTALKLGEFYDDAIGEIRAAGAEQIVFVEPSILWSGLGFEVGPHPAFTSEANIVFSPHLYAESITMDRDLGITPIVSQARQFELAERVADAYDTVVWSGEYGFWGDEVMPRLEQYAALEDAHGLGSAYWVWKQACGDPQNGVQATGDGLQVQDCATGEWLTPKTDILAALSRPYPRVVPGHLEALASTTSTLEFSGLASAESCDLEVWFPGEAKPTMHTTGVERAEIERVDGGWLIRGCVSGKYDVSAE